jgi:hypothetical protein
MKAIDSLKPVARTPKLVQLHSTAGTLLGMFLLAALPQFVSGADFVVTTPTFAYTISGFSTKNPNLTLVRGQTYTFMINASSSHPFEILSKGVLNNNTSSGTITFTVPDVVSNYHYICSVHFFGGTIFTVPANTTPPPPVINILNLSVTTNITLTSTGTNGWGVIPEFRTNLASTNWSALSVETNRFANGVNETICGRPPADTVFIRIRSQPN